MTNDVFLDGCCICPEFQCFLKEISIHDICYHHVDDFLQLIGAWETLYILVQYGTCVWEGISGNSCGARSLSMRARILIRCCYLPLWRVWLWMLPVEGRTTFLMVSWRNNSIIFLSHSHWFCNLKWLVPGCRYEYSRENLEAILTREVPNQWSSVRDDDHRWNYPQVLTYNNVSYHTKSIWGENTNKD